MNRIIVKILFTGIICLYFIQASVAQVKLSKTSIFYNNAKNQAVNDLYTCLNGYNAGEITIQQTSLQQQTGQEFYLSITGNKTIIKYTTPNSLNNAIYTYLDMLGFKWYGPGENWHIKPKTITRSNIIGQWMKPTFRNRSFFGTGGLYFPSIQPYDPENNFLQNWTLWKQRNRFNADFEAVGHTGQAFYLANKQILDKNPQWFKNESGKINGRLKIDNPAAVNIYKGWIRKIYENTTSDFIALGVDPEDGRGGDDDPLPQNMKEIKTHADKWWWLANEVAKDYPETNKKIVVTAYAYGDGSTNALAPGFKLRKNVYPVIIPYAFQKAYLPDEMVKVWAAKINGNMGIYDYWNITQWSLGMPQFDIYSIKNKLQYWNQHKVDGIYLETTDAAGPMGHSLWLAGQLQWNLSKNFEVLYEQYLNDCFGKAAAIMRRMYDRWSTNYQGAAEVLFTAQDLHEASNKVQRNSAEWKRITELKAYLHFMTLFYNHDGTQESKNNIFNYLYSIHHLMMVQTAAFIGQSYISPLNHGNIVPDGKGIRPLTETEIEKQFESDLKKLIPGYKIVDFKFDYNKVKYKEPIPNNAWRFGGYQCNFYFNAPFTGTVNLDAGASLDDTGLRIFTTDNTLIVDRPGSKNADYKETIGDKTWNLKKYQIKIEKGKTYFISLTYGFGRVKIQTPGIVLFKNPGYEDFDNFAYPEQYFYVPASAEEIVFQDVINDKGKSSGWLITPDGLKLQGEYAGAKNVYKVKVEKKYRGKVWKTNFGHPNWSFKNIPNITSLQQFDYKE